MEHYLPSVRIESDYEAMSRAGAAVVLAAVAKKPEAVLCVATGASPAGVYACLAEHRAALGRARVLKLDEWGGLAPEDPATCETYIWKHILGPWGLGRDRYVGFASDAPTPAEECARIEGILEDMGGIDVCILGMGADGHIGLNYPGETLPARAHVTGAETLRHAMLDAAEGMPTHGLTLGMGDILRAGEIVLVVNGPGKAAAVKRLLTGVLTPQFPASFLWMHPRVTCVLDGAAASALG